MNNVIGTSRRRLNIRILRCNPAESAAEAQWQTFEVEEVAKA